MARMDFLPRFGKRFKKFSKYFFNLHLFKNPFMAEYCQSPLKSPLTPRPPNAHVRVQTEAFDIAAELSELQRQAGTGMGAACIFVGTVRDLDPDWAAQTDAENSHPNKTIALELEHYPGMTEAAIAEIVATAQSRFAIAAARVIHRTGRLDVGEGIVLVAIASAHRGESFAACEFVMDYLKTRAPFWKKSHSANGQTHWVDARECDENARKRWEIDEPYSGK